MPTMTSFQTVRARAGQRKGGADNSKALLPPKYEAAALAVVLDDLVLAEMAKRIFTDDGCCNTSAAEAHAEAVE